MKQKNNIAPVDRPGYIELNDAAHSPVLEQTADNIGNYASEDGSSSLKAAIGGNGQKSDQDVPKFPKGDAGIKVDYNLSGHSLGLKINLARRDNTKVEGHGNVRYLED